MCCNHQRRTPGLNDPESRGLGGSRISGVRSGAKRDRTLPDLRAGASVLASLVSRRLAEAGVVTNFAAVADCRLAIMIDGDRLGAKTA